MTALILSKMVVTYAVAGSVSILGFSLASNTLLSIKSILPP